MKKVSTLLIVLISTMIIAGSSVTSVAKDAPPLNSAKKTACASLVVGIGSIFTPITFCCSWSSFPISVSCGFLRTMVPGEIHEERMIIEEWPAIIEEHGLKTVKDDVQDVTVNLADDTAIEFMESEEYEVYLLAGTYRVESDGAIICKFRKVLKQ